MSSILHIEASPRGDQSVSTRVARAFLTSYFAANPNDKLDHYPIFSADVPSFDQQAAEQKMQHIQSLQTTGQGLEPEGRWHEVVAEIERLKNADKIVISCPMWNFSIPYRLKQWIDAIAQPGLTFGVNRKGEYVGLLKGKSLQLITTSGSAYAQRFPSAEDGVKTDFQNCYLEHISRFIGIEDVRSIKIQAVDASSPEQRQKLIDGKLAEAKLAAASF